MSISDIIFALEQIFGGASKEGRENESMTVVSVDGQGGNADCLGPRPVSWLAGGTEAQTSSPTAAAGATAQQDFGKIGVEAYIYG